MVAKLPAYVVTPESLVGQKATVCELYSPRGKCRVVWDTFGMGGRRGGISMGGPGKRAEGGNDLTQDPLRRRAAGLGNQTTFYGGMI